MSIEWVASRIKELRAKTGLSQEKFAFKIHMDRSYFASVETGNRNVSLLNLIKIINGLNVSFEDFFRGK
ncbi:helix-turn-helix domain-containing protein [Lactobacillus helveticus]|uniref:Helix-turn-helix domain-containing protein n=1 Tax=Lactobacillus helveticus TaxID=1587 RepID=A0A6A7K2W2_LACHE|nr:helix-turn-helix transcriptional regulator [Lactobacillus helveticus]MPW14909.1 helix-turn-helix domain-containing protein [Lactobacillus helveticus]